MHDADAAIIQSEVDKALQSLDREMIRTESLFSVASNLACSFSDIEYWVVEYLNDDAANLIPFVKDWKQRHPN